MIAIKKAILGRNLAFNLRQITDAFSAAKICKKGFQNVFYEWTKSHFDNFDVFLISKTTADERPSGDSQKSRPETRDQDSGI